MNMDYGQWEIVANRPCNLPLSLLKGFNEATSKLNGATYTPLLYCAKKIVNGMNYFIIAKEKLSAYDFDENIVKIILNESVSNNGEDKFSVVLREKII